MLLLLLLLMLLLLLLHLQAILGAVLLNHKPDVLLHLFQNTTLPGETKEQTAARWRDVAVSQHAGAAEVQAQDGVT